MAGEKHRDRAMLRGDKNPVTVLSGKVGAGKGRATVRTAYGFIKDVASKDLSPVPDSDNERSGFNFQDAKPAPSD